MKNLLTFTLGYSVYLIYILQKNSSVEVKETDKMNINEVEKLTGLTAKSIRLYEEVGLINVAGG